MEPALKASERVLVLRRYPSKFLKHGQIVIVWPTPSQLSSTRPPQPFGVTPFIKRIIGMPGDTLTTKLSELNDFHRQRLENLHDKNGQRVWNVPENHVFVKGDAIGGFDSLSWGPVHHSCILGLVVLKLS